MNKFFLFILILISLSSCSKPVSHSQTTASDDYVLIEFAARLEEDYHKLHDNQKVKERN